MFGLRSKSGGVQWLVVLLGNPGPKYELTRHNAGFLTAAACEKDTGAKLTRARFQALTGRIELGGAGVLLLKPQTYMNLSGEAACQAARFYKLPPERVIVVSDDVSLPLGKLRVRAKGSAGGHNGLKSIIAHLGTDAFPRVKIGVGAPPREDLDMADWVLDKFTGSDAETMKNAAERAWEAVKCCITEGVDKAMNRYNG